MIRQRSFKSDNFSGVHQEIMAALSLANVDHSPSYGEDAYTQRAYDALEEALGAPCRIAFVFNGTGANVLALKTALRPYQSVVCSEWAHINTNETGAPESMIGTKMLAISSPDGKITPESIRQRAGRETLNEIHATQPKVLSIAQCTEYGTVYTPDELLRLKKMADELHLYLHMDGCRLYNAAAAVGCSLADMTAAAGVDILSLGGTKNGAMMAEAVVVFNEDLWEGLAYLQKNTTQLFSKNRFIAAQFSALFHNDLWYRNAFHANRMAALLSEGLTAMDGLELSKPVEANHVFIHLPLSVGMQLQEEGWCYVWNEDPAEVRFVCSFDTTEQDVDDLLRSLRRILAA